MKDFSYHTNKRMAEELTKFLNKIDVDLDIFTATLIH